MATDMLTAALEWYDAGMSVIPIRADGTKRPAVEWKPFMSVRASREQVSQWFTDNPRLGIGVICGAISGHLEMLELEGRAADGDHFDKIIAELDQTHALHTWQKVQAGYLEWTPSGGIHMLYRVADATIPGNQKIAQIPGEEGKGLLCLSETRGEGGYVIVAPSGGHVHPSGEDWVAMAGIPAGIKTITIEERTSITSAIKRAIDQAPEVKEWAPSPRVDRPASEGERPGDEMERRYSWDQILIPNGWQIHHRFADESFWTRPGKSTHDGHSATTRENGCFYAWSGDVTPYEKPLTKFYVYAHYATNGDLAAAAANLRKMGMGAERAMPARDDSFFAEYETDETAAEIKAIFDSGEKLTTSNIRTRTWDDIGNARRLRDRAGHMIRWVEDAGCWAIYEGGRWALDRSRRIDNLIVQMLDELFESEGQLYSEDPDYDGGDESSIFAAKKGTSPRDKFRTFVSRQRNTIRMAAISRVAGSLGGMQRAITEFDQHPMLFNCRNGVVDLRTGELMPHDPALFLMQQAAVDYDPDAPAPMWDKFIGQVLPNPEVADYLQRITGYSISGSIREQAMFLHNGTGANGKSVYLKITSKILADYGQIVPRSTLLVKQSEGHPTDIARMVGKRFLQTSETAPGRKLDEEVVKQLTGGEQVTARFLNKDFFDFEPTGKIHYVTNHLPHITNAESIWRRTHLVMWETTIPEDEQDKDLADKIFAEEASGVLTWMVRGAMAWLQRGLSRPDSAKSHLADYRESEDTLGDFIQTELIISDDPESEVGTPTRDIYNRYRFWSESSGMKPMTLRAMSNALIERGYIQVRKETWRGFKGITLHSQWHQQGEGSWQTNRML